MWKIRETEKLKLAKILALLTFPKGKGWESLTEGKGFLKGEGLPKVKGCRRQSGAEGEAHVSNKKLNWPCYRTRKRKAFLSSLWQKGLNETNLKVLTVRVISH